MISAQFLLTALVVVLAPGTGVVYTLALGLGQGRRAAIWAALGCTFGIVPHIAAAALGLAAVMHRSALIFNIVKWVGVAYLLWLAWKVARAGAPDTAAAKPEPLTFLQAAAFQWVNPKAWAMALNAITIYATGNGLWAVLWVSATFVLTGVLSTTSWTVLGSQIQRFLTNPVRLRAFNVTMALFMVASVLPVLLH